MGALRHTHSQQCGDAVPEWRVEYVGRAGDTDVLQPHATRTTASATACSGTSARNNAVGDRDSGGLSRGCSVISRIAESGVFHFEQRHGEREGVFAVRGAGTRNLAKRADTRKHSVMIVVTSFGLWRV